MDTCFPHLQAVMQTSRMQTLLAQTAELSRRRGEIADCTVDEVRYQPGKRCLLSYKLRVRSPDCNHLQEAIVTADLCPVGTGAKEETIGSKHEIMEIDGGQLRLRWFPNDRKLTALHRLFDRETMHTLLQQPLKELGHSIAGRSLNIRAEPVHYLAERSCMIRYCVEWEATPGKALQSETLYAKAYVDDDGAIAYAAMQALADRWPFGARALYYDADARTLWQQAVPGTVLTWSALEGEEGLTIMKQLATVVRTLHRSEVKSARSFTMSAIVDGLARCIRQVEQSVPRIANPVRRIVARLNASRAYVETQATEALLHRDLKLLNFLRDGTQLRLIDLDTLASGDALSDVGSFIANLHLQALIANSPETRVVDLIEAFRSTYGAEPHRPDWCWRWHVAAALLHEVVRRTLRQRNMQRLQHLDTCVELSDRYSRGMISHAD